MADDSGNGKSESSDADSAQEDTMGAVKRLFHKMRKRLSLDSIDNGDGPVAGDSGT